MFKCKVCHIKFHVPIYTKYRYKDGTPSGYMSCPNCGSPQFEKLFNCPLKTAKEDK